MTKCTEKYYPFPDDILRVERKMAKEPVEGGPQESFGNKEEERLQCLRCQGDETSCGTVILVRIHSKYARLGGNQSGGKDAADSTNNDLVISDIAVGNTLTSDPVVYDNLDSEMDSDAGVSNLVGSDPDGNAGEMVDPVECGGISECY